MKNEIIKLWKEYIIWLKETSYICREDMDEDFAGFMRWLEIYNL